MAMEKKFASLLFLLFLLCAFQRGTVVEVEGATCAKPSMYYKGYCGTDSSCVSTCQRENWPDGKCVPNGIFSFKCECRRPC